MSKYEGSQGKDEIYFHINNGGVHVRIEGGSNKISLPEHADPGPRLVIESEHMGVTSALISTSISKKGLLALSNYFARMCMLTYNEPKYCKAEDPAPRKKDVLKSEVSGTLKKAKATAKATVEDRPIIPGVECGCCAKAEAPDDMDKMSEEESMGIIGEQEAMQEALDGQECCGYTEGCTNENCSSNMQSPFEEEVDRDDSDTRLIEAVTLLLDYVIESKKK